MINLTVVTEFERELKISKATDASGDGTLDIGVNGEIHSVHIGCPTSGAVITIEELVEGISDVCITGDTVLNVVVTGNLMSVHPKVPVHQSAQATTIANEYVHPHVKKAKLTIASGGNTLTTYVAVLSR